MPLSALTTSWWELRSHPGEREQDLVLSAKEAAIHAQSIFPLPSSAATLSLLMTMYSKVQPSFSATSWHRSGISPVKEPSDREEDKGATPSCTPTRSFRPGLTSKLRKAMALASAGMQQ